MVPAGLEPATARLATVCSIQLSYGTKTEGVDPPGFEPGSLGCKPSILPLNYEPKNALLNGAAGD